MITHKKSIQLRQALVSTGLQFVKQTAERRNNNNNKKKIHSSLLCISHSSAKIHWIFVRQMWKWLSAVLISFVFLQLKCGSVNKVQIGLGLNCAWRSDTCYLFAPVQRLDISIGVFEIVPTYLIQFSRPMAYDANALPRRITRKVWLFIVLLLNFLLLFVLLFFISTDWTFLLDNYMRMHTLTLFDPARSKWLKTKVQRLNK